MNLSKAIVHFVLATLVSSRVGNKGSDSIKGSESVSDLPSDSDRPESQVERITSFTVSTNFENKSSTLLIKAETCTIACFWYSPVYDKLLCHENVIIEVFELPEACKT